MKSNRFWTDWKSEQFNPLSWPNTANWVTSRRRRPVGPVPEHFDHPWPAYLTRIVIISRTPTRRPSTGPVKDTFFIEKHKSIFTLPLPITRIGGIRGTISSGKFLDSNTMYPRSMLVNFHRRKIVIQPVRRPLDAMVGVLKSLRHHPSECPLEMLAMRTMARRARPYVHVSL